MESAQASFKIAVDLMGSEKSPIALFKAVIQAAPRIFPSELIVLATEEVISEIHSQYGAIQEKNISFFPCKEEILMGDDPITSIRTKKNSSLVTGIKWLKKKRVDGLVSLGNTGALIASATLFLPKIGGLSRPALVAQIPSLSSPVSVLDIGGNVQLKAPLLYQFAILGIQYSRLVTGNPRPKVALLNIGTESKKGTQVHQEAFRLLSDHPDFIGNMESRDVFSGKAQVVVTDGFAGNIFLKAVEGTAKFILDKINQALLPNEGHLAKELFELFDYRRHPGALLLGVQGIIVKVHGEGSELSLVESIIKSHHFIKNRFPST